MISFRDPFLTQDTVQGFTASEMNQFLLDRETSRKSEVTKHRYIVESTDGTGD